MVRDFCSTPGAYIDRVLVICRTADDEDLRAIPYAHEANRAVRDGSHGCLSGTRTDIMDVARDWAAGFRPQGERPGYLKAFDPESAVLWLCGVAGAGKSATVISLATVLHEMDLLGSVYSFSGRKPGDIESQNSLQHDCAPSCKP